jgi:tetratricopeptide (TPR) repeat protein
MQLALLIDPAARTSDIPPDERIAGLGSTSRVIVLPRADRLAHAVATCLGAEAAGGDDLLVLAPVGMGVIPKEAWQRGAVAARLAQHDDEEQIEAHIAAASHALDVGRIEQARDGYQRCEGLLAHEATPRRAEVLVCLAQIAERAGFNDDAATLLDQALSIFPHHRGAIAKRIELAHAASDAATAAAFGRRMLAFAESDDEKVRTLATVADDGLRAAEDALLEALDVRPRDRDLLERLRAVNEASGDWTRAVDFAVTLAEDVAEPAARARAFVVAADMCAQRAGNVPRAVALYEGAIADDPEVPGAFEAIEKTLLDANDFAGAERAYVRQLERLAGRGAAEVAVLDKLARVRAEKLGDTRGAIQALDRLVTMRPDDVTARTRLAELLVANGEDALAIMCLEVAARHAPTRVETFRTLCQIFTRTQDIDRAYSASSVLVHLGEADLDEQMLYQQFAPEVAIRPANALEEAEWELLFPQDHDDALSALTNAIAPAVIASRIETLRVKKLIPRLDPSEKQDAERSTVSAVRAVGFVARLFGVKAPDVYVRAHEVPGGFAMLPTIEPAIALGPSILSGRPLGEMTFLFARELAYIRLADRVLALYPDLPELRALVTAAIALVTGRAVPADVAPIKADLAARLDAPHRRALEVAVRQLAKRGGQLDLVDWQRSVERIACRAGMLACGDLNVAARLLSVDGRVIGGMSAADRIKDLIPFSISQRYAGLRSALGVAARPSRVG